MELIPTPSQLSAYEYLIRIPSSGGVVVLSGAAGSGRSAMLRKAHAQTGGSFLKARDLVEAVSSTDPMALEEACYTRILAALKEENIVYVDDFGCLSSVMSCNHFYQRRGWIEAVGEAIATYTRETGKTLIVCSGSGTPDAFHNFGYRTRIKEFGPVDYAGICRAYLPADSWAAVDFTKVHRFARKLNAYQLRNTCVCLRDRENLDTQAFLDFLEAHQMTSNVNLVEVQAVELTDLKGVDDVIDALEAHLVVPLENDALAAELDLKPKRGVLLAGPPGTGKTTVGRALAHRLRSKFFLIDGSYIAGTDQFYQRLMHVIEEAKQNAPSILFIDDSDVIFESGEEHGLYRYLLTLLDGLESETAGQVCVMMTAMDVANIPPALLRSGRIELWLEMRLPNEEARAQLIEKSLAQLPPAIASIDMDRVVAATEGFTGADLKRLVEDGKVLYAHDRARNVAPAAPTEYFLRAVTGVQQNRERYAAAEARARANHLAGRRQMFNPYSAMAFGEEEEDD